MSEEATLVEKERDQEEDEEMEEVRDYLRIFRNKCKTIKEKTIVHKVNALVYVKDYGDYENFEPLLEGNYHQIKGVKRARDMADKDMNAWEIHAVNRKDGKSKVIILSLGQAKVVCPHLLAFWVNNSHPSWPIYNHIWRWCADRRMVPVGDY